MMHVLCRCGAARYGAYQRQRWHAAAAGAARPRDSTSSLYIFNFLFFLRLIFFPSSSVFAVEVAAEVYSMQQGDDGELSQYDALVAALAKFGQGEEVRWHEHTNLRTKKTGGKEQLTKLPCS